MNGVPRVVRNDWSSIKVPELGAWKPTLTVSVVIPAYQCQESLDLTLASLSRQTYPAELMEVVVVDDGSEPRLQLPTIRPANCRIVRAPEHSDTWGIANAVHVGVRQSSGEIIQRLDADMVVFPEHVEAHARWHHELPYAVTLGSKRFVDVAPGSPSWPTQETVASTAIDQLFSFAESEPHDYIEKLLAETDQLRSADHLAFRAHVGATVALRRQLYDFAGGMDVELRRGSDTEIGYRLMQAGAVFLPEPQADSWHLGPSNMMRKAEELQRYSRPFLADAMPHPRWLRKTGGSGWKVPLVTIVVRADGHPLELVRTVVDSILASDETDIHVCLVGRWEKLAEEPRSVLADPLLDLRLVQATYRSDPRVSMVPTSPETAFPSPYLLKVPATCGLARSAISRLLDEADRHQVGLVRVQHSSQGVGVELWRTAALGRTRWVGREHESFADVVSNAHGARTMKASAAGVIDLSDIPPSQLADGINAAARGVRFTRWRPATVEVGGFRSLIQASALVARLLGSRFVSMAQRPGGNRASR